MLQYLDLMMDVRDNGTVKEDRTGTGTTSVFGRQLRFNLQDGFPLVTTKKLHLKSIVHELIWFLAGDTNIKYLNDNGVRIWNEWADGNGDLGPVYGKQWRSWPGTPRLDRTAGYMVTPVIDQIAQVIDQIKNNPDSRRMLVTAWNPADIPSMKLPPCHALFQFYTRELTIAQRDAACEYKEKYRGSELFGQALRGEPHAVSLVHETFDEMGVPRRYLDCQLFQRSCDLFLGLPFNIASYALLTSMIAHSTGLLPGEFIWTGGDCHIYSNHMEQVELQLSREPMPLPLLEIKCCPKPIDEYLFEDFEFLAYAPYPAIKAKVAV